MNMNMNMNMNNNSDSYNQPYGSVIELGGRKFDLFWSFSYTQWTILNIPYPSETPHHLPPAPLKNICVKMFSIPIQSIPSRDGNRDLIPFGLLRIHVTNWRCSGPYIRTSLWLNLIGTRGQLKSFVLTIYILF